MPIEFIQRHIGVNDQAVQEMLSTLGLKSVSHLIGEAIPSRLPRSKPLQLTPAISEVQALGRLESLAELNQSKTSLIGCGYHGSIMPAAIRRNILENPEWYTAYTPYQAEISQGRLEVLLSFQQMVIDLTGLDIANASMLDEATAAAEAMTMSKRISKSKSSTYFADANCHPQTLAVVATRAESLGIELITGNVETDLVAADVFGALVQYPDTLGNIKSFEQIANDLHENKALLTVAADILALTLLKAPGEFGADIAVGTTQRFGIPMGYGGPHAAYFATKDAYKRSIPGRIIGVSVDSHGDQAYRMALQTREQHIRRDKANSNICTSQVLLAVLAAMFAVYHGPDGVKRIASRVHALTQRTAAALAKTSLTRLNATSFDTLSYESDSTPQIKTAAEAAGFNVRVLGDTQFSICLDETHTAETITVFLNAIATVLGTDIALDDAEADAGFGASFNRESAFLTHPIFNSHHDETSLMRYIFKLARKDITLARSMIPLGSCTMKLNAAAEMEYLTDARYANVHPFVPLEQAKGYQTIIEELSNDLAEITGYDGFSMQPNAGSQGEYAGLLAIRGYHRANGDENRTICLIPSSAHGTNPASAVMAGMKVVIVKCDDEGNIDFSDLKAKAELHSANLAALMITYPSTYGVFEELVQEFCALIHEHGGQVYLDGANLNAMMGLCRPGDLGADVSHLNLHKTFAIPHGGGGPGMGPIGVKKQLIPYLTNHCIVPGVNPERSDQDVQSVSAAPWGSPLILLISWAYVKMMGTEGLKQSSSIAILSSNYIKERLEKHYPVRYTSKNGRVAHECIIDCSAFKVTADVSVEDIAKRLMDYGFHAPTMSWPVQDSLMIEPTESENKGELDRFINAMLQIREEIREVETGSAERGNNVLTNAPHATKLIAAEWSYPYSREKAFYPVAGLVDDKYWPPVGRLDNIYGDKNLFCSCPSVDSYSE